jgi:hypothetical protein
MPINMTMYLYKKNEVVNFWERIKRAWTGRINNDKCFES